MIASISITIYFRNENLNGVCVMVYPNMTLDGNVCLHILLNEFEQPNNGIKLIKSAAVSTHLQTPGEPNHVQMYDWPP